MRALPPPASLQDPLASFMSAVDAAGQGLGSAQREVAMSEVPKAMTRAALLMTALAHEH